MFTYLIIFISLSSIEQLKASEAKMKLSKTALQNINNSDYMTTLSVLSIHIGEDEANKIITDYVEFASLGTWVDSLDDSIIEILEAVYA